jgi:4-diphosphocytidyl-2-C-methyl-D-erythritol kinase
MQPSQNKSIHLFFGAECILLTLQPHMIVFPNAKINLGLNVTEKRPDGFHNLISVFYPIPFNDVLEAILLPDQPDGQIQISYSGLDIPGNPDQNLLLKVHQLISTDYLLPALQVHLHKVIPMGGGLGGGSSDAASFILLINRLADLNLSWGEMHHYAKKTGSDCSFFLMNKPCLVTETGTALEPLDFNLKGYYLQLVFPGIHIPTPQAYAGITPAHPETSPEEIIHHPPAAWKNFLFNDFEKQAFQQHPLLEKIKNQLYAQGAVYAAMTGSGSTLFGLFEKEPEQSAIFEGFGSKTFSL